MTKYRAVPTEVDGIRFASKKEAKRYGELKLLERAGTIERLETQPDFQIILNGEKICKVILDFKYMQNLDWIYEDVKGGRATDTPLSKLKRKLVEAQYEIKVVLT